MENLPDISISLYQEVFLDLLPELDSDDVAAIILHGSYVRGDAIPPYSDIDLVRILTETSTCPEYKRFIYRKSYLISISSRPLSVYRERLTLPEKAIFIVPGILEAHILLEKDGSFTAFQQEVRNWNWKPLQPAADRYASYLLAQQVEIALKLIRALSLSDSLALADMTLDLFSATTEAVAVQRGVIVHSGNTYFHEVQASMGQDSMWTLYHLQAAGIDPEHITIDARGRATLQLYQETVLLLQPFIEKEHWDVIAPFLEIIEQSHSSEETP